MEVAAIFAALPQLETEHLVLRRVTLRDVPDVFAYCSDPDVARYTTWEPHDTLDASRAFVDAQLAHHAAGEVANWVLALRGADRAVGTCGFTNWNPRHHRAEVAYALARPLWGQGLMTEALRRVCAFGFEVMGCNRIEARCLPENRASARVMEKVGMTFEGIMREHMYVKGAYRDLRLYAVLRREWSCGDGPQPR